MLVSVSLFCASPLSIPMAMAIPILVPMAMTMPMTKLRRVTANVLITMTVPVQMITSYDIDNYY